MNSKPLKKLFILMLFGFLIAGPSFAAEEPYKLLAPIPIGEDQTIVDQTTASNYIPGVVTLIIGIASVLAVLRIIFAGIKYMSTDAFQGKTEAKGDIENAIWGLALAMGAWLILNTINPSLTKFNFSIPGVRQGPEIGTSLGASGYNIDTNQLFFEGCHSCNVLNPDVPQKGLGVSCSKVNPVNQAPVSACLVSALVNQKLTDLALQLDKEAVVSIPSRSGLATKTISIPVTDWWVTEMYPPSLNLKDPSTPLHKSGCHNPGPTGGNCVDIALKNNRDADKVAVFLSAIRDTGMRFIYEVPDDVRKSQLLESLNMQAFANNIHVSGTAEHAHVGFWGNNAITP